PRGRRRLVRPRGAAAARDAARARGRITGDRGLDVVPRRRRARTEPATPGDAGRSRVPAAARARRGRSRARAARACPRSCPCRPPSPPPQPQPEVPMSIEVRSDPQRTEKRAFTVVHRDGRTPLAARIPVQLPVRTAIPEIAAYAGFTAEAAVSTRYA